MAQSLEHISDGGIPSYEAAELHRSAGGFLFATFDSMLVSGVGHRRRAENSIEFLELDVEESTNWSVTGKSEKLIFNSNVIHLQDERDIKEFIFSRYEVLDVAGIRGFLVSRPNLIRFLKSAYDEMRQNFTHTVGVRLELIDEQEENEGDKLYVSVSFAKNADDKKIIAQYHDFFERWWIKNCDDFGTQVVLGIL